METNVLGRAASFAHLYERRSSARSAAALTARALDGKSDLRILDISMGGMLATSASTRMPGTLFKVEIAFKELNETIELWAKVLDLKNNNLGEVAHKIEFCYLTPKATLVLYRHLDSTRSEWK